MIARRLAGCLLLLPLCGFVSKANTFRIDFPNGWAAPVEADKDGTVQATAPESAARAWCRANSVPLAALDAKTQKQLNSDYAAPFDRDTWAAVLSVDASTFSLSDGEARVIGGRIVQEVTLSFPGAPFAEPTKVRFRSYVLPHRMVNAGCFAPATGFDGWAPEFEATVSSLEPI